MFLGEYGADLAQSKNLLSSSVDYDDRLRQIEVLYCNSCAEESVAVRQPRPPANQDHQPLVVTEEGR